MIVCKSLGEMMIDTTTLSRLVADTASLDAAISLSPTRFSSPSASASAN